MSVRAALRATGAFAPYSDEELDLLVSVSARRRYAPGQSLCEEGTVGASCFLVVSGTLDVVKAAGGDAVVVGALGPGAIAGQVALVQRVPRMATLRARTEVEALAFSRDTFERLLGACSPLALRFQRQIAVAGIRQLRGVIARMAKVMGEREATAAPQAPEARASTTDALAYIQAAARDWDVSPEALEAVEFVTPQRGGGNGARGR